MHRYRYRVSVPLLGLSNLLVLGKYVQIPQLLNQICVCMYVQYVTILLKLRLYHSETFGSHLFQKNLLRNAAQMTEHLWKK